MPESLKDTTAIVGLTIIDADPDTVRVGDKVLIWFDKVSDTLPLPQARMA